MAVGNGDATLLKRQDDAPTKDWLEVAARIWAAVRLAGASLLCEVLRRWERADASSALRAAASSALSTSSASSAGIASSASIPPVKWSPAVFDVVQWIRSCSERVWVLLVRRWVSAFRPVLELTTSSLVELKHADAKTSR